MSYSIFIQKFKNGKPATFEFNELSKIISKYGEIIKKDFSFELKPKDPDLFEFASFSGNNRYDLSALSIHRPSKSNLLSSLIFEMLKLKGSCCFDQDSEIIMVRNTSLGDIPTELKKSLSKGVKRIESPTEIQF